METKDIHCTIGVHADVGNSDENYNFVSDQFVSSGEDNQLEYEAEKVVANNNNNDNDNNNVNVITNKVVTLHNLANRERPTVSLCNSMFSFQDGLNTQRKAEEQ